MPISKAELMRNLRDRRRAEDLAARPARACPVCDAPLPATARRHARYCSARCRARASRIATRVELTGHELELLRELLERWMRLVPTGGWRELAVRVPELGSVLFRVTKYALELAGPELAAPEATDHEAASDELTDHELTAIERRVAEIAALTRHGVVNIGPARVFVVDYPTGYDAVVLLNGICVLRLRGIVGEHTAAVYDRRARHLEQAVYQALADAAPPVRAGTAVPQS
jgi:hypothetical protein